MPVLEPALGQDRRQLVLGGQLARVLGRTAEKRVGRVHRAVDMAFGVGVLGADVDHVDVLTEELRDLLGRRERAGKALRGRGGAERDEGEGCGGEGLHGVVLHVDWNCLLPGYVSLHAQSASTRPPMTGLSRLPHVCTGGRSAGRLFRQVA